MKRKATSAQPARNGSANGKHKPTPQRPTLEDAVAQRIAEWSPPAPVDLREYLGSQLQYWFGLRPEEVRELTRTMKGIIDDPEAKDRDKIEAMNTLAQWKKLEMDAGLKVGDWLQQAGAAQPAASEVSDEQLLQGLRLLSAEPAVEAVAPAAAVAVDDEEILPLEGVG